ncbi:ABC transporter ATP-binding protein [Salinirarus marinus]|uniref:ABC transporter ATP-binding protein n=1 Tax=Salinirarus marinus TaxID=3068310 RepID=UPI003C6C363F
MAEALVAEDVRKRYGDAVAVDGVSFSVAEGEVFGLVGPNGAGKTTLVRSLTGTTPCDGEIRVLGASPPALDPNRVGLLPQSFRPADRLTARELVRYYAGLYDEPRDPDAVIADVGVTDAADQWYENLSGGQRRRVCVGAALVNDPDVLFLDEPTTGIDPAGRRALWDLFSDLAAGGTSIFLTSHSMGEVERLADRVGLLRDGELVAVGDPDALVAEYGGESRLVVETGGAGADALADGYESELVDGELVVYDVAAENIGDVVRALETAGVTFDSFTWTEPDLEDVYLRLTGETLDDFDADARAGGAR